MKGWFETHPILFNIPFSYINLVQQQMDSQCGSTDQTNNKRGDVVLSLSHLHMHVSVNETVINLARGHITKMINFNNQYIKSLLYQCSFNINRHIPLYFKIVWFNNVVFKIVFICASQHSEKATCMTPVRFRDICNADCVSLLNEPII